MVCLYGYILCVLYAHMYSVLVHEYIFREATTLHSSVCAVRADLRSPSLSCPTLFQGRLLHDGEQLIDLLPVRLGDVQDELVPWSDFLEGDRCWNLHTNRLGDALDDLRERARDFDHRDLHVGLFSVERRILQNSKTCNTSMSGFSMLKTTGGSAPTVR